MDGSLQLRDITDRMRRRWRVVALVFAWGMISAVVFLFLVTTKYTATATLKFDPTNFQISRQDKRLDVAMLDRFIAGEIAAMRSVDLLGRVVEAESLVDDPELGSGFLNFLRKLVTRKDSEATPEERRINETAELLQREILVEQPGRSNLISVHFTSRDPDKAARIANAIVDHHLARHLEFQIDATPLASKWLGDRVAILRDRWQDSERQVESFRAEHNITGVAGENLRDQQIAKLNEQLVAAHTETEDARARVEQVRTLVSSRDPSQLANVVRTDVMTGLRARLADTTEREAELSETLMPAHPTLRAARAGVARLNQHILAEGRRHLAALEIAFNAAKEREALMRESLRETVEQMDASGDAMVRLRQLERTAASDRTTYETLLNRSQETSQQSTGGFVNLRLVQKARAPVEPSFPSGISVLLIAAIGSLVLGIGQALWLPPAAAVDRTASRFDMPAPIATLPTARIGGAAALGRDARRERLVALAPDAAFSRAVSRLTALLTDYARDRDGTILAVTSAIEREGKTMVAASIAQRMALGGARTVLIDCNFANPSATEIFRSIHDETSAGDDRAGRRTDQPVLSDRATGLEIVPAFAGADDALRFVGSQPFFELLNSARKSFDLVVVDTGALLSRAESRVITGIADATLLVANERRAPRDTAMLALGTLTNCRANLLGVVANRVESNVAAMGPDPDATVAPRSARPAERRVDLDDPRPAAH